jgi:hypothetical protein
MNKPMRLIMIFMVIALTIIQLTGCTSQSVSLSNENKENTKPKATQFDYKYYNDIEQIITDSNLIVTGEIIEVHQPEEINVGISLNSDDKPLILVYIVSDIKIDKVIKGKAIPGDIIKVKQYVEEYNKIKLKGTKIEYFKKQEKGLFFLANFDLTLIQPYSTLNPIQGDIKFENGIAKPNKDNILFNYGDKEDEVIILIDNYVKANQTK